MKTFSTALANAYASGSTTLCAAIRVLRNDGVIATFCSADHNVVIGGETYLSAVGMGISNLVVQAGLQVDNLNLTVLPNETTYPGVDILAGRWDNAAFWLFECDYMDSGIAGGAAVGTTTRNDINLWKRGTTGEASTLRGSNLFEFRSLKQALQQPVGAVTSKTCRARLGDAKCRVDLGPWTHTYAVTAVTSRHQFTCSSALEVDDYYGDGTATGTDGENAGYTQKVKAFAAGVVTLSLEMPFPVFAGDHITLVAGCRKRLMEDCKAKFNNVLNFQGEPHMRGPDVLMADPTVTAS